MAGGFSQASLILGAGFKLNNNITSDVLFVGRDAIFLGVSS